MPGALPNTFSGAAFGQGFWSRSVAAAPAASDSAAIVANLAGQITSKNAADLNDNSYTTAFFTVPAGTTTGDVHFDDCQGFGYTPDNLQGPNGFFTAVPIPDGAQAAAGDDAEMTIWQPSTDKLWELYHAVKKSDGWHACAGGRIDGVSTSPGYFPDGGGATATDLPVAGGMVTLQDVQQGHIDHAVVLLAPTLRKTTISWPAQATDGRSTSTSTPVEGQRFRLDPSLDLSTLGLSKVGLMIAKAAQVYGFVITDTSGSVAVQAEDGMPLQRSTGTNPWTTQLGGMASYDVLDGFPWRSLTALPISWGKPQ